MKEISTRRQKRLNKKDAEKSLIALWRKQLKLFQASMKRNLVELDKPIRNGYMRFFVLREDVAKSREAHVYRQILPLLQHKVWCSNKKFLTKSYKTKKFVPMEQALKDIEHKEWNKLQLTEKQKALFKQVWRQNKYNPKTGRYTFEFIKPWVFVYKIEHHYKTHQLIMDPDLESELAQINNTINSQRLWPKFGKILGWRMNDREEMDTVKNRLIERYYGNMAREILGYAPEHEMEHEVE